MSKRIFRAILLVATAVLLLCFTAIMGMLYEYFTGMQREHLKTELSLAAYGVETDGQSWLDGLSEDGYRLTLIAVDGTVLYDSAADAAAMENHLNRAEVQQALSSGSGESERSSVTLTEKTLYQARRLSDGRVLRISVTQNSVLSLLLGMLTPLCIVLFAAILFSALLAGRIAKDAVRPLNSLDLDHPLENAAYDELSPLLLRIAHQQRQIDLQVQTLQKQQAEFSAITASMREGLVLLNGQGVIVSINPAAQALFKTDEKCIGRVFLTLERRREVMLAIDAAAKSGHGETVFERDGRRYQLEASALASDAQHPGVVLLSFDVTEKALAEERRREFSANVSHELKTPLQSIIGSAELMENGLVSAADTPRFVGHIKEEATRLVSLIEDILRLSQLDEGAEVPAEQVDLCELAKEAAATLAHAAEAKNVSVEISGESAPMLGVKELLFELVYNLTDNAIRYNNENGSVKIDVKNDNRGVTLSVKDSGVGIAKEHQERIFERFYRVDKSRSKASGGTGLGLSIVKHAAQAHHAKMQVESEPGQGTKISVFFPRAAE